MGPRLGLLLCLVIMVLVAFAQQGPRCAGEQRAIAFGGVTLLAGCRQ
jgi:hypothetical protein